MEAYKAQPGIVEAYEGQPGAVEAGNAGGEALPSPLSCRGLSWSRGGSSCNFLDLIRNLVYSA